MTISSNISQENTAVGGVKAGDGGGRKSLQWRLFSAGGHNLREYREGKESGGAAVGEDGRRNSGALSVLSRCLELDTCLTLQIDDGDLEESDGMLLYKKFPGRVQF